MRTATIVFVGAFFSSSIMIDFNGYKFFYKNRLFLFLFFRVKFFFYLLYSIFCSIVVGTDSTTLVFARLSCWSVSYTHLRAHETDSYLVCRLLLEKKKKKN